MKRSLALLASLCTLFALATGGTTASSAPAAGDPVIGAVGDIACKDPPKRNRQVCQYDDVSDLVFDTGLDRFLALGDVQYEYGRLQDFRENYDVHFGRALGITAPVPGNHEYGVEDAQGYFDYFGARAHGPGGYYSFDLGAWHVIALNSAICRPYSGEPCGPRHPQYQWLAADLAAHPNSRYRCTLAYWHHPRWDWLKYQNADWLELFDLRRSAPLWKLLYQAGADVVLTGHNHNYMRWLPQDPRGRFDPKRGIVEFIVGTGGRNLNGLGHPPRPLNLATGWAGGFGILRMTLHETGYDFRFVPAPGQPEFIDEGSGVACH